MGNDLGLDIPEIVNNKLDENNRKYPAEKAYGKADKYTAYAADGGNMNITISGKTMILLTRNGPIMRGPKSLRWNLFLSSDATVPMVILPG